MIESIQLELSILMPCLNEVRTVGTCIQKARRFLSEHGISGEVLVADNGSTDGSIELAERLSARVIPIPVRGYGAALSGGIAAVEEPGRSCIRKSLTKNDQHAAHSWMVYQRRRRRSGRTLICRLLFRSGSARWSHD